MARKRLSRECRFCDTRILERRESRDGLCLVCWDGEPGKWARGEKPMPDCITSYGGKMRLLSTPEFDVVFL
jgi:hypothetical protein